MPTLLQQSGEASTRPAAAHAFRRLEAAPPRNGVSAECRIFRPSASVVRGASTHQSGCVQCRGASASGRRRTNPGVEGQAIIQGLTLPPAGCVCNLARSGPNPAGSRRNGLEGVRRTAAIQIAAGGGCSWQARKNRLASATEKQDDSGVHHAKIANGKQDVFVAAATLAGTGAKEEAVSQLTKLGTI